MTSREDLLNAISLNISIVNGARVEPSVAGLPRVCSRLALACNFFAAGVRDAIVLFKFKHSAANIVHDEMRQCVMGLWSVVLGAMIALGRLEADAVAHSVSIKTI